MLRSLVLLGVEPKTLIPGGTFQESSPVLFMVGVGWEVEGWEISEDKYYPFTCSVSSYEAPTVATCWWEKG